MQKPRKSYQSFPDQPGGSQSYDKLQRLRLPPLKDKSFLDAGCNEGFFCGFAKFQGARRSVGIDLSADFIQRARQRFKDCEFHQQSWDVLPDEKFDVILLASAIHYASDQAALIGRLVDQLAPDGTLVVELGIVPDQVNEWVPVKRSIDTRYFPTMLKLREVLEPYAWKYVGKSVSQAGDPIPRHVVHIRKRRPVAYLLMMPPSFGKSAIAQSLSVKAGISVATGDALLNDIARGRKQVSEALGKIIAQHYATDDVDRGVLIKEIFSSEYSQEYLDQWAGINGLVDTAFDGFVPAQYHDYVVRHFSEIGYFPVNLSWNVIGGPITSLSLAKEQAQAYIANLAAQSGVPAEGPADSPGSAVDAAHGQHKATGFVDRVEIKGQSLVIRGWAFDASGERPKDFSVSFAGQTHNCEAAEMTRREDVKRKHKLKYAEVGFIIRLRLPGVEPAMLKDLSVRASGIARSFALSSATREMLAPAAG